MRRLGYDPDGDDGCPGDDDTREAKWERAAEAWPDEHDPNEDLPEVAS